MKIDFATLAFGYNVISGGNTPNWATALGQGKNHKINNSTEINELLKGMLYSSAPVKNIKTKIGKGGRMYSGSEENSPIISAAVFNKVYVNDILIDGGSFILVVVKDLSGAHTGRLKLKYGPSNTFDDGTKSFSNQDFIDLMKKQLGMANDACWFVSEIEIRNQDELILTTHVVKKDGPAEYQDVDSLHSAWSAMAPFESPYKAGTFKESSPGKNIIFYGIPGCGKSYKIKNEYCDDENFMERVVFHPDYTYSDFIGQILPESSEDEEGNKHISYPFIPGPFTRIVKKAYSDSANNYYLVIEELNRGNAPAIFGEVFQLLDRIDGESEYGIDNAEIALIVYGDACHKVKIPSNLFILATMNTADQNVFTLDTAFKRRWQMESVVSDFSKCSFANNLICRSGVKWCDFVDTVNNLIIESSEGNIGSEDKRLGAYFVKENELSDSSLFSEKVLMYLWNDAFKYNHEKVFRDSYKTLEALITGFKTSLFDVFTDNISFTKTTTINYTINNGDIPYLIEEYLSRKPEEMVSIYKSIYDKIVEKITTAKVGAVKSGQYLAFKSDDISKASFADIKIQTDKVVIFTEKPSSDLGVDPGKSLGYDGHHNHYYQISVTDTDQLDDVVSCIIDSYKQLVG